GERVEGRLALFRGGSIRNHGPGAQRIAQAGSGGTRRLRRIANLLAHLGCLAVPVLDLFEDFGGNTAGCAVLLQSLHHLGLGRKEGLEKLADLIGGRLPLASRLERLARFGNLIAAAQELLTGRRRLLPRTEGASRGSGRGARDWRDGRTGDARSPSKLRRRLPQRQHRERQRHWESPAHPHDGVSPRPPDSSPSLRPGYKKPFESGDN